MEIIGNIQPLIHIAGINQIKQLSRHPTDWSGCNQLERCLISVGAGDGDIGWKTVEGLEDVYRGSKQDATGLRVKKVWAG